MQENKIGKRDLQSKRSGSEKEKQLQRRGSVQGGIEGKRKMHNGKKKCIEQKERKRKPIK